MNEKMNRYMKFKLIAAVVAFIVPLFLRPVLVDAGVNSAIIYSLLIVSMIGFASIISVAERA